MKRLVGCLFLVVGFVTSVEGERAQRDVQLANETEIVALPPLIVEWKDAPLRWRYVELPGFELLTVCDDETATEFVRRNHRIGELLRALVPDRFLFKSSVREAHILFNERTGRARSPEVIEEMVRSQGATVGPDGMVQLRTTVETPSLNPPLGLRTVRVPARSIFFLPNLRLDDRDSLAVFSILPATRAPLTFGYSEERVKLLLERRVPALPDWFIEGTLGVFRLSNFGSDVIEVKHAMWFPEDETSALARDSETPRVLLPMAELFGRARLDEDGAPHPDGKDGLWRAQCALFVRWALADTEGTRREALGRFIDRLEREALTEEMFRDCFGMGLADMRDRLSDYLPGAARRGFEIKVPPGERLPRLKPRPATALEVARIRGDWERRQISYVRARYPDLVGKYLEQTRTTLNKAYAAGERDPRLMVQMGLTELEAGDHAAAERFLTAGATDDAARPGALFELARLRYGALPPGDSQLTAAQAESILPLLERARNRLPALAEVYSLMAQVWMRRAEVPDTETLAALNEGARLFPRATGYVLQVVAINLAAGRTDGVRELAEMGLRYAREPSLIQGLENVRARLGAVSKQ